MTRDNSRIKGRVAVLALLQLVWILALAGVGPLWAGDDDFSASARVGRTRMTPEETLTLQVVVRGGEARVDTSAITDFQILSQGSSTHRSWVNGKSEHKVIYQYRLAPNKSGTLVIPTLTVSRDGEARYTDPIRIRVVEPTAGQSQGEGRPVFARSRVSRTDPVVGEQLVYTFELYTARQIARGNLNAPEFEGFNAQELKARTNRTQVINGMEYAVTGIQYLLTPKEAGSFTIDPALLSAQVVVSRRSNDPLDSFFNDSFFTGGNTKTLRIRSNPVEVTVSDLPPHAGDIPFSGLVGEYTLSAELDRMNLAAGESATLTCTLMGRGNLMDAVLPQPELAPGLFKVYEDSPTEEFQVGDQGILGKKVFKRALVPLKAGTLQLPPLKLVYFNTRTRSYDTLVTDLFSLEVTPSGDVLAQAVDTPQASPEAGKQAVELVNQDILDIRPGLSALASQGPMGLPLFLGLLVLPVMGYTGAALWVSRRGRRRDSLSRRMAHKAKDHLNQVGKLIRSQGDETILLQHLRAGIIASLCSRVDRRAESLTREEVREILESTHGEPGQTRAVLDALENIDNARFGRGNLPPDQVRGHMEVLKGLIRTGLILLVCIFALGGKPDISQAGDAGPSRNFIQAVDLYRTGEYVRAAQGFEALAQSGIVNADLFYNAGNAWLKAGDLGRAILWYERALEISPRDPDLLFNLDHARSRITDKEEGTPPSLALVLDNLPPLKYLQLGSLALALVFFIHALVRCLRRRRVFTNAGKAIWILALAVFMLTAMGYYRESFMGRAVIIQETVAVRSGTDGASTRLFDLHAGTRVRVRDRRNGYLKIAFTPDKVGWVKIGDALEI